MKDRLAFILMGIVGILLGGTMLISDLLVDCRAASTSECRLLWGMAVLSVLGGGMFVELLLRRREWFEKYQDDETRPYKPNFWRRAIFRVVLSSLLASSPLLVRGSFVVVGSGTFTGFLLAALIAFVSGRAPVVDKD